MHADCNQKVRPGLNDVPSSDGAELSNVVKLLQDAETRLLRRIDDCCHEVMGERHSSLPCLRDAASDHAVILNTLPIHIALLDRHGTIVAVNEAWTKAAKENCLPGTSEPLGSNYLIACENSKRCGSFHAQEAATGIRRVLEGRISQFDVEFVCHGPSGDAWFQMEVTPLRDVGIGGVVVTYLDITERKLVENRLRESEARFRQLAENIHGVFWMVDPLKDEVLYVSPAAQKVWGQSGESLLKDWNARFKNIHPDDRKRVAEWCSKESLEQRDEVYRIHMPDGALRWVRDRAFPVKDASGAIYRMVGVAEDVTDIKKLEAQYLRAQRLDSLGTLAGGIAHDLNNILAPVLMSASLLRASESLKQVAEITPLIEESARRGVEVVSQLLSFSRGKEIERVLLQPRVLLKDMVKIINETFPKDIRIELDAPNNLWLMLGDSIQLHQVLLNLSVNARDAMPEGGTLTMTAENVELDEAYARDNIEAKAGPYVKVRVQDTGAGIAPEYLSRIFDPFFTTKPLGKGTGLGLSTVLGIVKNHGGFIAIQSELRKGSVFEVFLPARPHAKLPAASTISTGTGKRGNGELVLLVDDEPRILKGASRILESSGYKVVTANDGLEALAVFAREHHKISVVVSDLLMPSLDGFSLVRGLHKIEPNVKVILMSGISSDSKWQDKITELKGFGVNQVLAKPFHPDILLDSLYDLKNARS